MAPPAGGPGGGKDELGSVGPLDRGPGEGGRSALEDPGGLTTGGGDTGPGPIEGGRPRAGEHDRGRPRP